MPQTKLVRPKPAPPPADPVGGAEGQREGRVARRGRAHSCQARARGQARPPLPRPGPGPGLGPGPGPHRRTRSTCTAPPGPPRDPRRAASSARDPRGACAAPRDPRGACAAPRDPKNPKGACAAPRDPKGACAAPRERAEPRCPVYSSKAFTVIPPNPKKRREIQRKAEAELAALEELRLSRAMAYVSISPSRVGGCMSLEEVRLKQQQEMIQAKRKPKQVKVMEETPVLSGR